MSFWLELARSERNSGFWLLLFIVLSCSVLLILLGFLGWVLPYLPGHNTVPCWKDHRLWIVCGTLSTLMLFSALLTWSSLNQGSAHFARFMGAKPLPEYRRSDKEQLFYDLCCEMSAASLTPMPSLYVFPRENSVNAMVAGSKPTDTVLIVTEAALTVLNKDELQALIAHEFSHLAAGDALLNLRLITTLSGIHSIYQLGETCVSWSQSDEGQLLILTWAPYILGQGIKLLGWIGLGVGRFLRAGLNREREFLADANAIRLTRYPPGMQNLLYYLLDHSDEYPKIRICGEAYQHMLLFGGRHQRAWTALHPTLEARLLALDPAAMARWRARHRQHKPSAT